MVTIEMKQQDVLNGKPAKILVIAGGRILYSIEAKIVSQQGADSAPYPAVEFECVVPSEEDQRPRPKAPTLMAVPIRPLW